MAGVKISTNIASRSPSKKYSMKAGNANIKYAIERNTLARRRLMVLSSALMWMHSNMKPSMVSTMPIAKVIDIYKSGCIRSNRNKMIGTDEATKQSY
jgi:hypothetical protein